MQQEPQRPVKYSSIFVVWVLSSCYNVCGCGRSSLLRLSTPVGDRPFFLFNDAVCFIRIPEMAPAVVSFQPNDRTTVVIEIVWDVRAPYENASRKIKRELRISPSATASPHLSCMEGRPKRLTPDVYFAGAWPSCSSNRRKRVKSFK